MKNLIEPKQILCKQTISFLAKSKKLNKPNFHSIHLKKKYGSINFAFCSAFGDKKVHQFCRSMPSECDSLGEFLQVLPISIQKKLAIDEKYENLLEIVMDLGRQPEVRYFGKRNGEFLRESVVTMEEIQTVQEAIGDFGRDNRAGMEGTLHRISAIRNRNNRIIGLTCRFGRAVEGHAEMFRDILDSSNSILFLGRPGIGKTSIIRELARTLSEDYKNRVIIIDTSNEIGGDGDIPNRSIGNSRRMQVPNDSSQHQVMIEAVENHTPEVIIADEISNEGDVLASRSIAERGITLIATAHGQTIENLIKNPPLSHLIGGIQPVTLSDEEARTRGTRKSTLERQKSPTFPILVEIRDRYLWVVHWVEDSVDAILSGQIPIVQIRRWDPLTHSVVLTNDRYNSLNTLFGVNLYDQLQDNYHLTNSSISKSNTESSDTKIRFRNLGRFGQEKGYDYCISNVPILDDSHALLKSLNQISCRSSLLKTKIQK